MAEEEKLLTGGAAVIAEVGAVPTEAVKVTGTLAVLMHEGHTEGALLSEGGW